MPTSGQNETVAAPAALLQAEAVSFLDKGPYSLTLAPGECLGLSGPSGVGKTQLLRALADLIPHEGKIWLHGNIAQNIPAPAWRRQVCLVPADPVWWYEQVGEHFPQQHRAQLFLPVLERLGFAADVLGWEVTRLSMGERQRLALVRALAMNPEVLLLDEPTASLDFHHVRKVEELIAEVRHDKGLGTLWISHDPEQLARVCERILIMEQHGLTPTALSTNQQEV